MENFIIEIKQKYRFLIQCTSRPVIWDSLRYHNKKFIFLKMHLDRLYKDAKLTDIKIP